MNTQLIPEEMYNEICDLMPVVCVDAVIESQGKVLLVKRTQKPKKGNWWFVGGRLLKNEKLSDAVKRKVREEVGLECDIRQFVGVYETFFNENNRHTVNVTYIVTSKEGRIKLDETSSECRYFSTTQGLDPYLKRVLKQAGLFVNGS